MKSDLREIFPPTPARTNQAYLPTSPNEQPSPGHSPLATLPSHELPLSSEIAGGRISPKPCLPDIKLWKKYRLPP